jgi:hypothetical protein
MPLTARRPPAPLCRTADFPARESSPDTISGVTTPANSDDDDWEADFWEAVGYWEAADYRPEPEREGSFWRSFNRADAKLLLITFAGTVAANVVTVIVVAIAILSDRPPASQGAAQVVLAWIGLAGTGTYTGVMFYRLRRNSTVDRRGDLRFVALLSLATLIFLLFVLGYAVGYK